MNTSSDVFGPDLPNPKQNFPALEEQVLQYWATDKTFAASLANRKDRPVWTFYDGPPFANGLPHYGHLLTGYAKDVFPRFQTMRGKSVPRQFGWDTHGLPAELEAMKQLGLTEKADVVAMGVDKFNEAARGSVLEYVDEWREYVNRQGRWVDFEGGYKTLDLNYMESVMWAFKRLHDKGLAYEGYRVLPYCWKDQTPLSTHELNMDDDVYRSRNDQSATVAFDVVEESAVKFLGVNCLRVLAWTTTPWTLPMNMALAVNPELEYVVVHSRLDGYRYLLGASRLEENSSDLGYFSLVEAETAVEVRVLGSVLAGLKYEPLWNYYSDTEKWGTGNAWQVLLADFVTDSGGTGVVHLAPAHGEDDQKVCEANGVPTFVSVDDGANYLPEVVGYAGLNVFDAVKPVLRELRARSVVFSEKDYRHDYPHCWRCGTPLVYKAVSSWFVRVTELRDRMVELNGEVNWTPANVGSGSFHNWLTGARDWSVSRNRFWGSPVPVWKSDSSEYPRVDVYGSVEELEKDFGVEVRDLHRPFVDDLVRPNPDDPTGLSMMRRVEDVLDVWFDSGSMPFAQMHYPFENVNQFEENHPSDFVVEYVGQVRGWFYVMHVLSTALFDRPAFKNAVSHGVVLGNDGLKMSKKTRNYPDVNDVFNRDGSDAMRWLLMSSPVLRGGTMSVSNEAVTAGMRDVMLPLWNTYSFYRLYSGDQQPKWDTGSTDVLDRYLFAKLHNLVREVGEALEQFDTPKACSLLATFMDMLNNWYVRRSRSRFWSGEDVAAFNTLYTVLEVFCRVAAPLLPMVTEVVWRGLTAGRSVHLEDYPMAEDFLSDDDDVNRMDLVRSVVSSALALRKKRGSRVRQPLASMTVVGPHASTLFDFRPMLQEELNVHEVVLVDNVEQLSVNLQVGKKLKLNAPSVGKRLGSASKEVFAAVRAGDWKVVEGHVVSAGYQLEPEEYEVLLVGDENVSFFDEENFLFLDFVLTPKLEREGFLRDLVRAVQDARRNAELDVSDRVKLRLVFESEEDLALAGEDFSYLAAEVLAVEVAAECSQNQPVTDPGYSERVAAGRYVNVGDFEVLLTVVKGK